MQISPIKITASTKKACKKTFINNVQQTYLVKKQPISEKRILRGIFPAKKSLNPFDRPNFDEIV